MNSKLGSFLETGFYWASIEGGNPTIAYWNSSDWFTCGRGIPEGVYCPIHVAVLSPRLTPPTAPQSPPNASPSLSDTEGAD